MAGKLVPSHFSDVSCYNFIGCALKIFRFLNDSRYLSWSLVSYESLVIYKSLVEHRTFVLLPSSKSILLRFSDGLLYLSLTIFENIILFSHMLLYV